MAIRRRPPKDPLAAFLFWLIFVAGALAASLVYFIQQ
jgi:hypothetical protein